MGQYVITRAMNLRIYEQATAQFASDEEAMHTVMEAHLGDVTDYSGHIVALSEVGDVESVMPDVTWQIERVPSNGPPNSPIIVTHGHEPLRPGSVSTCDLLDLVEQVASIDFDWPLDRRSLRSLVDRAKLLQHQLKVQQDFEGAQLERMGNGTC